MERADLTIGKQKATVTGFGFGGLALLAAWLVGGQLAFALSVREAATAVRLPAATTDGHLVPLQGDHLLLRGGGNGPATFAPLDEERAKKAAGAYVVLAGPLGSLEKRLLADAADGQLDDYSPSDAALVAGGVQRGDTLQGYRQRQAALVDELRRSGEVAGTPRQRAQAVFELMHRRALSGGYHVDATDLRLALDRGRFNCVSASVLFNYLAGEFGLEVCGLEIPGHVRSRVFLGDGVLDVETTCPRWFRLMGDPQKQAELVEKTIGVNPSQNPAHAREVSAVEMAAMIYYNRGVDLLAEGQFAAAAAANAKALWLDPSSGTARGNLLATLNNWAVALGNADRYTEARNLLRQGLMLDPAYTTFAQNYIHVHHQWVEDLCLAGRFEEALEVLARAAAELPDGAYFRAAPLYVYGRWARELFDRQQWNRAFAVLDRARRRHGDRRELREMEVAEVNRHALALRERGRWEAAAALFQRGIARYPDAKLLRNNHRVTLMRRAEPVSGATAADLRTTRRGAPRNLTIPNP